MFNLFISSSPSSWDDGCYELEVDRVLTHTADPIQERYKSLNEQSLNELKSFPCLFVIEREARESRIGKILDIRLRQRSVYFTFQLDETLPALPVGAIQEMKADFDISDWELYRTHWAVKDEPLFEILVQRGHMSVAQHAFYASLHYPLDPKPSSTSNSQVFVVHGHDTMARLEVSDFLKTLNVEPIVLQEQPSAGRTIIEKIEQYSNVGFAVVLYTRCDLGFKDGTTDLRYRARQNVIFEHGYMIGKLGRNKVAALHKEAIEPPNDMSGVVYLDWDEQDAWKGALIREMRNAGYPL